MHPHPNPLLPKQLKSDRLNTLLLHLERQLAEEQLKEDYQQRLLSDITAYSASLTQSQSMVLTQERVKTESAELMSESKLSVSMESEKKSSGRKVQVDFEMEYQQYSKEINKLIDGLSQREGGTVKKSLFVTPKKNSSMMRPVRTSRTSEIKLDSSVIVKGKTEREWKELSEHERIMLDFGETLMIGSTDEVVLNLVRNVKAEEEKYVAAVLATSERAIRNKMKNYMQRQSEKNEQTLFKLQQEAMDKQLVKLQANKEIIRDGYTALMKQLIEQGLRAGRAG